MEGEVKTGRERNHRDYILPVSIVLAALIIGVALVYNAGTRGDSVSPENNEQAEAQPQGQASPANVKPVSAADHIFGSPDAPVKLIEFSDLECPFCKRFHKTMQSVMALYEGRVAFIFRNFPLAQLHSKAAQEAQAGECAAKLGGNAKYWQYIDGIFEVTPSNNGLDLTELPKIAGQIGLDVSEFNKCLSSDYGKDIIQAQMEDAINSGAEGTPYSVVIAPDGSVSTINGAMPLEQVKLVIDAALQKTR